MFALFRFLFCAYVLYLALRGALFLLDCFLTWRELRAPSAYQKALKREEERQFELAGEVLRRQRRDRRGWELTNQSPLRGLWRL